MKEPHVEFLGHPTYGGWYTVVSDLNQKSIVYGIGVGDDISWDLAIIEKFGCPVFAFDPDPTAISWLANQSVPSQFVFVPEGLASFDGVQRFYDPYNANKVSMSVVRKNKTFVDLPVKRLATLMRERGHDHIDLLKMDIEGAEYSVLPDILGLDIKQLLVEVHQEQLFRFGWKGMKRVYGWVKTKLLFFRLRLAGYRLVCVNQSDYTFIRN